MDIAVRFRLLLVIIGLWFPFVASEAAGPSDSPGPSTNAASVSIEAPAGAKAVQVTTHATFQRTTLTFGLDKVSALQLEIWNIPLWQYFASFIYILLAFSLSKLLDYLVGYRLKKWADRTGSRRSSLFLGLVQGPVKIVSFVILLHIGLQVFDWPPVVRVWFSRALKLIVALSLTYMALRIADLFLGLWKDRAPVREDKTFQNQLFPVIQKSIKGFIILVSILVTSQNMGLNITGLIASLSIGGLALGLAAQDTLANLFGAVAVFVDKPFQVGDRVQLEGVDGIVEGIGLRSTRVRNLDGFVVTIPNKTMGTAIITNVALRPTIKTVMNIGLTYDTPAERLKEASDILEQIFRGNPMTSDLIISFNQFAESSLNIQVIHWWKGSDTRAYLAGLNEMNLAVKKRFDEAKLNFAFPSRTLYLKQDSEWKLQAARSFEDQQPQSNHDQKAAKSPLQ